MNQSDNSAPTPVGVANNTTGQPGGEVLRTTSQQIPDDPSTIRATTERSGIIQLLYSNFLYFATYVVTTTQKPGAIIFAIPIHPKSAGQFNSWVSQMFNAWTGDLRLRCRLASSALYGGILRIAHLPPNITRNRINQMNLRTLSAYPSMELNPQSTEWAEILGTDQRNKLYHEGMVFDETNPDSFGGWLICFVESSLIASSDGSLSISLAVETTGAFVYDQANPSFGDSSDPVVGSPLMDYILRDLTSVGLSSTDASPVDTMLYTISDETIEVGTMMTGKVGTKEPHEYSGSLSDTAMVNFRSEMIGNYLSQTQVIKIFAGTGNDRITSVDNSMHATDGWGFEKQTFSVQDTGGVYSLMEDRLSIAESDGDVFGYSLSTNYDTVGPTSHATYQDELPSATFPSLNYILKNNSVDPNIVIFGSSMYSIYATMSKPMARYFNQRLDPDFTPLDETQSWVFVLVDRITGVPIAYLRFNPNGIITTNYPSDVLTFIGQAVDLQYESQIPLDESLPTLTTTMRYHSDFMASRTTKLSKGKINLKLSKRAKARWRADVTMLKLSESARK
jgi:hypothetical protein